MFVRAVLIATLPLAAVACEALIVVPKPISIAHLRSDMRRFHGTVVTVEGVVEHTFGIAQVGVFELKDRAGEKAWAITHKTAPTRGARLRIRATACQAFVGNGDPLVVLLEADDDRVRDHPAKDKPCELHVPSLRTLLELLELTAAVRGRVR